MLRSLRALTLFAQLLLSYGVQWLLWRLSGRRLFGARWESLHERNAQRLSSGFTHLRGVYIKLGQVISVIGTFLPQAYGAALSSLQDAVPPRPFSEITPRLIQALGPEWREKLIDFQPQAVAAASLAQVHKATTADGTEVAVKILYPGIESLIATDLRTLRWMLPVVRLCFGFKRADRVLAQLTAMLAHETDYVHELQNIQRMQELFGAREDLVIPKALVGLSSAKVLVMSFEEGVRLTDVEELKRQGIDSSLVANVVVDVYLSMLLEHQVFHADPHPGNLLARKGNRLVMLDYGAVEDLSDALVGGIKKVMLGGLSKNPDLVIQGIDEMGFVAEGGDRALLERVGREYLTVLASVQVSSFARMDEGTLRRLSGFEQIRGKMRAVASSLHYPEGYFYVERTIALLFGLVGQLAPEKGLLAVAAPYASKALMKSFQRKSGTAKKIA